DPNSATNGNTLFRYSLGTGLFYAKGIGSTWCASHNVLTADVNGDGRSDVICLDNSTRTVYELLSSGVDTDGRTLFTKTHWTAPSGTPSCQGRTIQLADFDGDGKADIFCRDEVSGASLVALSDGTGSFSAHDVTISLNGPIWCSTLDNGWRLKLGDF